jgi:catechol 2,3-dioxygenase-like lactoylglutathione lyase family enzyme
VTARVWPQPLLVVRDVARSRDFYCAVLGGESGHGGDEYEQVLAGGELVLQLHRLDVIDHHGPLADANVPLGNGILVWFEVSDFDAAVDRARAHGAEVTTDVHENPNARQRELWLRDPDGYTVVLADESAYRPRA